MLRAERLMLQEESLYFILVPGSCRFTGYCNYTYCETLTKEQDVFVMFLCRKFYEFIVHSSCCVEIVPQNVCFYRTGDGSLRF